ncbi:MAG: class I SAM-dependent methyltransferase [Gammaproteobacteria bacterium]
MTKDENALVKTYRATTQWNHWLTQFLGHNVLESEKKFLLRALTNYYGKHTLLLGVPLQNDLLKASVTAHQVLLTPMISKTRQIKIIEAELDELPIASGSVDLVLLPHTLEYLDNPRLLLSEACRIVKPEGHIVILGFNPFSFWGLKKMVASNTNLPWSNNFIQANTVKKWLGLADFELVKQDSFLFRPPVLNHALYRRLKFLEWVGKKCYRPFGGVYVLVAKAKVIPLTPIRLRWEQGLSSIRTAIPGPTMRDF